MLKYLNKPNILPNDYKREPHDNSVVFFYNSEWATQKLKSFGMVLCKYCKVLKNIIQYYLFIFH